MNYVVNKVINPGLSNLRYADVLKTSKPQLLQVPKNFSGVAVVKIVPLLPTTLFSVWAEKAATRNTNLLDHFPTARAHPVAPAQPKPPSRQRSQNPRRASAMQGGRFSLKRCVPLHAFRRCRSVHACGMRCNTRHVAAGRRRRCTRRSGTSSPSWHRSQTSTWRN